MKNRTLVLLILCTFTLMACGNDRKLIDKLTNYLESRYDEKFEKVTTVDGVPLSSNKDSISALFTCESFGEQMIKASYNKSNGHEYYADNYMAVKYNKQARDIIDNTIADAGYTDYDVRLDIMDGVMSIDDIESYSLDDYMQDEYAFKSIDIILYQDTLTEYDFNNIIVCLSDNKITVKGVIVIPENSHDIVIDDRGNLQLSNVKKMVTFSLVDGEVTYERWSN